MAPLGFLPHLGHHHLIFTFTSFLHLHFSSLSESWIRPDVGPSGYFCYNQTYYIKHILSLTNIFFFLLTFVIKWVNTSFLFFIEQSRRTYFPSVLRFDIFVLVLFGIALFRFTRDVLLSLVEVILLLLLFTVI